MKQKSKTILISVFAVLCVITIITIIAFSDMKSNLNELAQLKISNVDLSEIEDGDYTGEHSTFPVSVEVKVTVKDHKITAISLEKHDNGKGSAAEVITDKVIDAQSLEVDVISGATYSSKAILKAIENALNKTSI